MLTLSLDTVLFPVLEMSRVQRLDVRHVGALVTRVTRIHLLIVIHVFDLINFDGTCLLLLLLIGRFGSLFLAFGTLLGSLRFSIR